MQAGRLKQAERQGKRQKIDVTCSYCQQSTTVFAVAAPERVSKAKPAAYHSDDPPTDVEYDAVIVGSGMGGLATATQMASAGAKVVVLEK